MGPAVDIPVPVSRRRLAVGVLAVGAALVLWSLVWQYAKGQGWEPVSLLLDRVLDADQDRSVLNWLSTAVWLLAALAALLAARAEPARRACWWGTAAVLLVVSLDESTGLHDPVTGRAKAALAEGGTAVVPVLVGLAVAGALFLLVLVRLPSPVALRLGLAGGLLLGAAVGVDSLGRDLIDDPDARLQLGYLLKASLEEALEVVAAVLALDACLLALVRAPHRATAPRPLAGAAP